MHARAARDQRDCRWVGGTKCAQNTGGAGGVNGVLTSSILFTAATWERRLLGQYRTWRSEGVGR
eukprot:3577592-Rhodomonas_salina.2